MRHAARLATADVTVGGLVLVGLLGAAGYVALVVTWAALAAEPVIAYQLPLAVSGGLGGLGLIAVAAVLGNVHVARRVAARRRDRLDDLATLMADLVAAARVGERTDAP